MDISGDNGFAGHGHAYIPGPPAMFIFLNEIVMDHVKDGLDWCYTSIFLCQWFYCSNLESQRQSICARYWKSVISRFTADSCRTVFSLIAVNLSLCHILWYYVSLTCMSSMLYISLMPLGKNSTACDSEVMGIHRAAPEKQLLKANALVKSNGSGIIEYVCITLNYLCNSFYFRIMVFTN